MIFPSVLNASLECDISKPQSFIDLANSELEAYHQEAQLVRDKVGTQALKYNKLLFVTETADQAPKKSNNEVLGR